MVIYLCNMVYLNARSYDTSFLTAKKSILHFKAQTS